MNESSLRMTDSERVPSPTQIKTWIGKDAYGFWTRLVKSIEKNYPDVFTPEWLFGGKKQGWSLRYKKGKSFCTLIPERQRFALMIVFGADERARVETIKHELSSQTKKYYNEAKTYHDGKWLLLTIDSDEVLDDVELLLAIKRKPKR